MLTLSDLQNVLHAPGLSNLDRSLLCLGMEPLEPRRLANVVKIAANAGWHKTANLAVYLSRAKGLAFHTPEGWQLTEAGKQHVSDVATARRAPAPLPPAAVKLRTHLPKLTNADVRAFVEEAIASFEASHNRSAVVFSWVGAVAVLYDYVVANKLAAFNAEATKRSKKWKAAVTTDDLTQMKEYDFLQILPAVSMMAKSVKDELETCLKFRNGCGHPNSLTVGPARVAAHIETLVQNVFEKY